MTPEGLPKAPAGLGEAGRAVWADCWRADWVMEADRSSIVHLCRLEDEADSLCERVGREGSSASRPIVAPKGDVVGDELVAHPLIGELRKLDAQLQTLRRSLGLSPESRARYGLAALVERRPDFIDDLKMRVKAKRELQGEGWEPPASERGGKGT